MRHFDRILLCAAIAIALLLSGTLMAAPQKVVRQKAKPGPMTVTGQKINPVTTIDQSIYKQKRQQLLTQIREDKKKLKADKLQLGKDNPSIKSDRMQLRKNEKALKQLQKTYKKGRKK